MAPTPKNDKPVSFDSIIKRSRERKKDEALANQILGSGRRKSAPAGPSNRKAGGAAGSLASRVGVTKRSSTAVPKPSINSTRWSHDLHRADNPKGTRFPRAPRTQSASRLESRPPAFNGGFKTASAPKSSDNINIRGRAAPQFSTVVASNFAPGTTAADIEAVMGNVGGEMVSCKLTSARPTVIAEMQFAERAGAENVIATFNNRKVGDDFKLHEAVLIEPGRWPIALRLHEGRHSHDAASFTQGVRTDGRVDGRRQRTQLPPVESLSPRRASLSGRKIRICRRDGRLWPRGPLGRAAPLLG
ncbi:hypothetical protein IWX92DRAFT_371999 [Phyllosticta citricarpa]